MVLDNLIRELGLLARSLDSIPAGEAFHAGPAGDIADEFSSYISSMVDSLSSISSGDMDPESGDSSFWMGLDAGGRVKERTRSIASVIEDLDDMKELLNEFKSVNLSSFLDAIDNSRSYNETQKVGMRSLITSFMSDFNKKELRDMRLLTSSALRKYEESGDEIGLKAAYSRLRAFKKANEKFLRFIKNPSLQTLNSLRR